ncbi:MAG: hypothetical protein Q9M39_00010 [Sulfurovum sp.]|nr:hypothetical protein [Sulfurovum sp.]
MKGWVRGVFWLRCCRKRQAFKTLSGKVDVANRDEQFKNIEKLKEEYKKEGNPVLSMDVKKKSF